MDEQKYILEAEKRVLDIKGLQGSIPEREINTVGVIGAGTMAVSYTHLTLPTIYSV